MSSLRTSTMFLVAFFLSVLMDIAHGQMTNKAPSRWIDGKAIDQGIAYFLMLVALLVTFLLSAFSFTFTPASKAKGTNPIRQPYLTPHKPLRLLPVPITVPGNCSFFNHSLSREVQRADLNLFHYLLLRRLQSLRLRPLHLSENLDRPKTCS
ncbi:hypothetical protein M5K25_004681 [Dendrobium thyrsiflorum]|uniref:Uncharacterized protein n=1 Tax=Dendrobium thyrsiflorum TaxID=117978 RepID=A0ABD0VFR6_DENTH